MICSPRQNSWLKSESERLSIAIYCPYYDPLQELPQTDGTPSPWPVHWHRLQHLATLIIDIEMDSVPHRIQYHTVCSIPYRHVHPCAHIISEPLSMPVCTRLMFV